MKTCIAQSESAQCMSFNFGPIPCILTLCRWAGAGACLTGVDLLGDGRAAEDVASLQQQNLETLLGQIGGRDKTVVTAVRNNNTSEDVEPRRLRLSCCLCSDPPTMIASHSLSVGMSGVGESFVSSFSLAEI